MSLNHKKWQEMLDRIEVIESLTRAPEINTIRREQILKQVKALKMLIKDTLSQINPSE